VQPPPVLFAETNTIEKVRFADEGRIGTSLIENQSVARSRRLFYV
jgi:hypothetical protein